MENYLVEADKYIPGIDLNAETGIFEITGQSYHEFTEEFYKPMFLWLKEYLQKPGREILLNFKLSYFNTATSKCFLDLFTALEEYVDKHDGKVKVQWFYQDDDEDMMAIGEDFALDTSLEVDLISMPESPTAMGGSQSKSHLDSFSSLNSLNLNNPSKGNETDD